MAGFKVRIPQHREFTGGDLLAQSLQQLGVKLAFGLHGGHLDAFLMGCADIGIQLIDTRHETVAVQAAEGYYRATGEVGTCFVTANSGFSNGIPGLATAFADRSSIFCATSSAPLRDAETNCLQGTHDQVVIAKPMTKFAHRVTRAEEIPRLVAYAFRVSQAGAPGPVLIDFPIDILFSPLHQPSISWGAITSPLPYLPGPHPEAVSEAVLLLQSAKRPAIIIGTGARSANAVNRLQIFAEKTNIPIFYTIKFSTTFPCNHPQNGGLANLLAYLPALGKSPPDLIILLGARTGLFLGGQDSSVLPSTRCKYIQVDTDGTEIGRSRSIDLGIVSDVGTCLTALLDANSSTSFRASDEWAATATSLKNIPSPHDNEPLETTPGRPHPYHALKALFKTLGNISPGAIVINDGGEANSWAIGTAHLSKPHLIMGAGGYMGFLGTGFGCALGAAIAELSRLVVNIQGDGSAGLHIAELDTYARFNCKVLTVVLNNGCWGMSLNGQDEIYGALEKKRPASALSESVRFDVVAEGLGNTAKRVDNVGEIESAVEELLNAEGPALLELVVSKKPTHPGTVAMVGKSDDPNVVVVPYYANIPRAFYKA